MITATVLKGLISSDHFLLALHHILQSMNKNYTEKTFNKFQQNAVIISNFFSKFDINQFEIKYVN